MGRRLRKSLRSAGRARPSALCARLGIVAAAGAVVAVPGAAAVQTFTDYFLPMPIINSLTSDGWGASNVQPSCVSEHSAPDVVQVQRL